MKRAYDSYKRRLAYKSKFISAFDTFRLNGNSEEFHHRHNVVFDKESLLRGVLIPNVEKFDRVIETPTSFEFSETIDTIPYDELLTEIYNANIFTFSLLVLFAPIGVMEMLTQFLLVITCSIILSIIYTTKFEVVTTYTQVYFTFKTQSCFWLNLSIRKFRYRNSL